MRYFTKHIMLLLMLLLVPIYLISCSGNSTNSFPSDKISAAAKVPSQPAGLKAVGGDSHVHLRWTPPNYATSFNLYWSMKSGVTKTSERILNVSMPFTHDDLTNGTAYFYRVSAANIYGESEKLSEEVRATPVPPFTKILTKLTDPDAEIGDQFGYAVAIDGNYAIVGAPLSEVFDINGTIWNAGAAYIFHRSDTGQWDPAGVKLRAPDAQSLSMFGIRVSISGDYAIVGAPYQSEYPNTVSAAYIFHKKTGSLNTWDEVTKLVAPGIGESYNFGSDVSISGDYAIVGDELREMAFVFHRTGTNAWDSVTMLPVPPEVELGDNFGRSVAISGDYVIVSAYHDCGVGNTKDNVGAVYIFHRTGVNTWGEYSKIMAFDGEASDQFGRTVAISGDYAVVGTSNKPDGDDRSDSQAGAAYIFHRVDDNFWDEGPKIVAPDPQAYDMFARSVAISDRYVLIGAWSEDCGWDENEDEGSAYIYERIGANSWDRGTKITIPAGDSADYFGFAVAISGESAIIGAFGDDGSPGDELEEAGAAYLY